MFDKTFENEAIDEETFKTKYLSMMIAREKLKREVKVASLLDNILQRCDRDEIDSIFALQSVLREEEAMI
jgi:hypothetical protein